MHFKTVIVADGIFPAHEIPLNYIGNAERVVCCDGSTQSLLDFGREPSAIVGDMDSISDELAKRFADRIFRDTEQDTNDLTKAVKWCCGRGYKNIVIVGATGKREDHTIGNISLLAEYSTEADVVMVTDTGIFRSFFSTTELSVFPGQQVSIFSLDPETEVTSHGLKFPLKRTKLDNWWKATLNEATGDKIRIEFAAGRIIVYLKFL